MTTWGTWTCPTCGRSWEGSIGYFDYLKDHIRNEGKGLKELLEKICGCTEKKITEEDMKQMVIFTKMAGEDK